MPRRRDIKQSVQVTIEGIPELQRQFDELAAKSQRAVLRNSLRHAARSVVAKAAKANLKAVGAGKLVNQIKVKASVTTTRAVADVGAYKKTDLSRIGHLLENGTHPHVIRTRSKRVLSDGRTVYGTLIQHPGTLARPWLNPALKDNEMAVMRDFGDQVEKQILKVIQKSKMAP